VPPFHISKYVLDHNGMHLVIGEVWFFGLGGLTHGERGAQTYNGGLGAVPPAGSRGRAPGGESGGRSPPEAENFSCFWSLKDAIF